MPRPPPQPRRAESTKVLSSFPQLLVSIEDKLPGKVRQGPSHDSGPATLAAQATRGRSCQAGISSALLAADLQERNQRLQGWGRQPRQASIRVDP